MLERRPELVHPRLQNEGLTLALVLSPALGAAALVLCVAGWAKLRSPRAVRRALSTLGLPSSGLPVRVLATAELALGATCLLDPTRLVCALVATAYVALTAVAWILARREADCGCFGEATTAASPLHLVLNAALATAATAAVFAGAHPIWWFFGHQVWSALALCLAIAGSAYGLVIAYTQLPRAWTAWSGR